jgi:hypothetical protein
MDPINNNREATACVGKAIPGDVPGLLGASRRGKNRASYLTRNYSSPVISELQVVAEAQMDCVGMEMRTPVWWV